MKESKTTEIKSKSARQRLLAECPELATAAPDKGKTVSFGDTFLFRPDECYLERPDGTQFYPWLVGIPIYTREIDADELPFTLVALSLVKPCIGLDSERKLVAVPAGETVVLTVTAALQIVEKIGSRDSDKSFVVWMRPKAKVDIGKGRSMWRWEVRVEPAPVARPNVSMQLDGDLPPQLQA